MDQDAAYAACLGIARAHDENFPVASWLVPSSLRPHIAAVYAFARIADDYADEPGRTPEERLLLLADWRDRLHRSAALPAPPLHRTVAPASAKAPAGRPPHRDADAVFVALAHTIRAFDLPLALFADLISAFEQDVETKRYETWSALADYCRRSANPVGRLVLRLFGYRDDRLDRASDALCTALQLTNFWQDLAVDWARGRLYVPSEVWRRHGADTASLDQRLLTDAWEASLRACATHTRALFVAGRPVCDLVSGRLAYELRATWLGGSRVLDALEHRRFDVFTARPSIGVIDALVIACRTLAWRRGA